MDASEVARNVRLYQIYLAFHEPLLWGPVLISALMHLGRMSLASIYFCESVTLAVMIILQVPTGALADLIGRKKTIIVGSILNFVSMVWFALIHSPFDVWGANMIWVVSASLCSGADSALIYDSLKAAGREDEYKKVDGRAAGNQLLMVAICALFVGYLARFSLRLPLLLSLPGVLLSSLMPFFFKEPPREKKFSAREQWQMMKMSVLFVANHKAVKWIIAYTTLLAVSSKLWFFTYNPYFELVALPLKYYGGVFFVLGTIAWFFSRYAQEVSKVLSERMLMVGMVLLIGVPILTMGSFVSVLAVALVFPQNIVRGFMRPFMGEFLNRHLDSENRATVLSVKYSFSSTAEFVSLGLFGMLLSAGGLSSGLKWLGASVLLLGALSIYSYERIFRRQKAIA